VYIKENKKKLLIISPSFFGYREIISNQLTDLFLIKSCNDKAYDTKLFKFIGRSSSFLFNLINKSFFNAMYPMILNDNYAYVLIIKGEGVTCDFLKRLKKISPNIKIIIYFYDSHKNMGKESFHFKKFADHVLSFDINDCKKYNYNYLPLFYSNDYKKLHKSKTIDFLFIGTCHTDRVKILKKFLLLNKLTSFKFVLYFRTKIDFYFYKLLNLKFFNNPNVRVTFQPMQHKEINYYYNLSNNVIDIERSVQSGLTIRTMEVLATGCRLVTTNPYFRDANFSNVLFIDRKVPLINKLTKSSNKKFAPLSLNDWINKLSGRFFKI